MIKTLQKLKDYVLLFFGAPVIAVNLTDEELTFCAGKVVELIERGKMTNVINPNILDRMVKDGATALSRYIVAKKKFNRLHDNYLFTPEEDGFAEMTQANSDWAEFVQEVNYYRQALRKPSDERDAEATEGNH